MIVTKSTNESLAFVDQQEAQSYTRGLPASSGRANVNAVPSTVDQHAGRWFNSVLVQFF